MLGLLINEMEEKEIEYLLKRELGASNGFRGP